MLGDADECRLVVRRRVDAAAGAENKEEAASAHEPYEDGQRSWGRDQPHLRATTTKKSQPPQHLRRCWHKELCASDSRRFEPATSAGRGTRYEGGTEGKARAHLVHALGEAARDGRAQHAVDRRIVEALEEGELGRVGDGRRGERVDLLDDNVRVACAQQQRRELRLDGVLSDLRAD